MSGSPTDTFDAEALAGRVRDVLGAGPASEKRMFGGVTFLLRGNMLCCASAKGLMVRVGRDAEPLALTRPFAQPCLGTGRRMAGFIIVAPAGIAGNDDLRRWISLAADYVATLPPRTAARRPPKAEKRAIPAVRRSNRERTFK